MKKVLIGCGGVAGLLLILTCGGLIWLISGPESGVKLANEMDPYATKYLADHEILLPGEQLVAYFDATLMMDGTEASILTTKRVITHKEGVNSAMELAKVDDIKHRQEPLTGDIFEIYGADGDSMKIEIASMNGGETFKSALMGAWQRAKDSGAKP